ICIFFFFQAEDGIRDRNVTGVQTCALPISENIATSADFYSDEGQTQARADLVAKIDLKAGTILTKDMLTTSSEQVTNDLRKQERSEERRVGKESRSRRAREHYKKKERVEEW